MNPIGALFLALIILLVGIAVIAPQMARRSDENNES